MRYEDMEKKFKTIKEPKRSFILSLLKDFIRLEADLEKLKTAQEYIINEKDPTQQVVLPIHKVIHDKQAQKNDIATKILRSLDNEANGESELLKRLAEFG